jgi:hypothetical protein
VSPESFGQRLEESITMRGKLRSFDSCRNDTPGSVDAGKILWDTGTLGRNKHNIRWNHGGLVHSEMDGVKPEPGTFLLTGDVVRCMTNTGGEGCTEKIHKNCSC